MKDNEAKKDVDICAAGALQVALGARALFCWTQSERRIIDFKLGSEDGSEFKLVALLYSLFMREAVTVVLFA